MDIQKLRKVLVGREGCEHVDGFTVATPPPQYGGAALADETTSANAKAESIANLPPVAFLSLSYAAAAGEAGATRVTSMVVKHSTVASVRAQ